MPIDIIGAPARVDIVGQLSRFEAEDTQKFSLVSTLTIPATVQFMVFNTDGNTLMPVIAQSGQTVTVSALAVNVGSVGLFFVNRQLPTSVGFYTYEYRMWGSSGASSGSLVDSVYTVKRGEFEVTHTQPQSFFSYGDKVVVLGISRQLVARGDLTERDVQPYMEGADAYINAKLGTLFSVPITPTPNLLRDMSQVFATWGLWSDRVKSHKDDTPPAIVSRRDWFEDLLDNIVEGKAAIEVSSGTIQRLEETVTAITGGIEGGVPTHGKSDFEDQEVDRNITDAESDWRDG